MELIKYFDEKYPNVERWKYETYIKTFLLWHEKELQSAHLKWNKEMREMIGEDEGEKKELDNIDKAFGVTGFTVVNDKQMIRNQFRHQLLEQLEEKK